MIGRLNSGQSIEQELSFISDAVIKEMKKTDNLEKKHSILMEYFNIACPKIAPKYHESWVAMDHDEKEKEIKELETEG